MTGRIRTVGLCMAISTLAGCLGSGDGDGGIVSRFRAADAPAPKEAATQAAQPAGTQEQSLIIGQLQARRSVLASSSSYGLIAQGVLGGYARPAEAELRSARLRAEAQSKNWLPSIGPNISLSSMGQFVAQLFVEQVLFDNGRKKAERAFAKADVEVAAASLSIDTNARVYDALDLYLKAEEGREVAAMSASHLKDMAHFEWVMSERVRGGVSHLSDLNVLQHKVAEMRARQSRGAEATAAALAELNAMSDRPLGAVRGLSPVSVTSAGTDALPVLKAEAEKQRTVAGAQIERAAHLPGLKASGTVGKNSSGIGLQVTTDRLFGLGTGASLKAIEAAKDAASRQVAQAREDSTRRLRALQERAGAADRQAAEAESLTAQARTNLTLFRQQYEAGQRQVMEVVSVYETFAAQEEKRVALKYQAARIRLQIAQEMGLLADGSAI